jgi:redox-sensitive bicupin YhaK (pirin superfamily)
LEASAEGVNRSVYFYEGKDLTIQDMTFQFYHAAEVDPTQKLIIKNGDTLSKLLVLQGMPISEPVVQHGPFVMNTREEIQQAFDDYHETQYGGWPWPKYDLVHDRTKKRFALHSDGREEIKES